MRCPSCGAENEEAAEVCFTCRAVLSAVTQGSILGGRYEVLGVLGRGGMGTVYRARDRALDEEVAVKVLRVEGDAALDSARRFRSEIKLARRVAHPNVCRIYEYGEDDGRQYISMELVEGTNLKEVLRQRGPLPAAFDVAIQVAEGLEAIHAAGVVHRDLKTPNVMQGPEGAIKVMDFGIAKRLAGGAATAPSGSYVVGSPEYMSPEQARGQPIDARSDLYALGVVVFELFTGRVPFHGDTPVATLLLHLESPPPLDGEDAARIPAPLRPVLRKALAKDPAARYSGAGEMARALRTARDASIDASAADAPSSARQPWLWLALAALMMVVTLVGFDMTRGRPEPSEAAPTPTAALSPIPGNPSAVPAPDSPSSPASTDSAPRATPSPRHEATASPAPLASVSASATPSPARRESFASPEPAASASPPPAVAPSPTPLPVTPSPSAAPVPAATPSPTPTPARDGVLAVQVTPWADVSVDNRPVGQTPLQISLPPGSHAVVLTHPDFQPYRRRIEVAPGQTVRLVVHLAAEGVRRQR